MISKNPNAEVIREMIAKINKHGKRKSYSLTGDEILSIISGSSVYGYTDGFTESLRAFSAFDDLETKDFIKDLHAEKVMKNMKMTPEEYVEFLKNCHEILLTYIEIFKDIKSLSEKMTLLA